MRFNKSIVTRQGLFENLSLDLDSDIIIISGKNGSGKSILAKILVDSIWRKFNSSSLLPDDVWDTVFADIQISINNKSKYNFIHNNNKNFSINSITEINENETDSKNLLTIENNEQLKNSNYDFEEPLNNFIKKNDTDIFYQSSFIPSPSEMEDDNIINYACIKNIILQDKTGFYHFMNKLENSFGRQNNENILTLEKTKHTSIHKDLDKDIQLLDIKNSRKGKLDKEKKIIKKEISDLKKSLSLFNNQIDILNKLHSNLKKIDEFNTTIEKINSEVEDEKKIINSISNLKKELDEKFPQFKNIKKIDNLKLDKLQEIFIEIRNLNEQIDSYHSNRDKAKNKLKKIGLVINISSITIILSILINNSFLLKKNIMLLAGIFGSTLISSLLLLLYSIINLKADKFSNLNNQKNILEDKLKDLLEESNVELEGYKLSELYEFLLQYFEDYIEFSEKSEDITYLEKSLKDKNHLSKIKKELSHLKKIDKASKEKIDEYKKSLENNQNIELEPDKTKELIKSNEVKILSIEKQLTQKNEILKKIENETSVPNIHPEKRLSLIEKKSDTEHILKKINSNQLSIYFILEIMKETIQLREEEQLKKLIDATFEKFNYLTNNQFIAKMDKKTLRDMIDNNRKSGKYNTTIIHPLILSLKIVLSDFLINSGFSLPLIIDDPFILMDTDRTKRFKEMIIKISKKRQVIIFTHLKDKKDWGKYIEL